MLCIGGGWGVGMPSRLAAFAVSRGHELQRQIVELIGEFDHGGMSGAGEDNEFGVGQPVVHLLGASR